MTENPGRIHALLDDTMADEPPLLDLVPAALTGARHSRHRTRTLTGGVAAAAVLAVTAGAYGLAGTGRGGDPALGPASGGSDTAASATPHTSDFGIPGLFDNPGAPQQQCSKIKVPPGLSPKQVLDAWNYCVGALTQVRALLPDDVVVLQPTVDFDPLSWRAVLAKTPDGGTLAGFVGAYQKAAKDPANLTYSPTLFAFKSAHGYGTVTYENLAHQLVNPKPAPGGDLPAGDGTRAHLGQEPDGSVDVRGVSATGLYYDLSISGVDPVFGVPRELSATFNGDGKDHEVYPDGYVQVTADKAATPVPNPYSEADVRAMLTTRGLASLVKAIGMDPMPILRDAPPMQHRTGTTESSKK